MKVNRHIRNADLFNVFTGIWEKCDILVKDGRILYTGDISRLDREIEAEDVVDVDGRPVIPGLIDIHLHIESSLCTPGVFADAVIGHGVTTVVSEPHEIANVYGLDGIKEMIRVSRGSAIDILFAVPSSVPSTNPGLETTGGEIGPEDLEELLTTYPEVVCLGEVMSYGDLIDDRPSVARDLIRGVKEHFPRTAVEGHCPSIRDFELAKVLFEGVDSDHCLQDLEGLRQRIRNGMFVEIQEKSILPEIITHLSQTNANGLFCFVTDDVPPDVMETRGHLDYVIRKALALGMPIEMAITAATRSPAARIGLRDRGAVAPGKIADFVILENRGPDFPIREVYKSGVPADSARAASSRIPVDPAFMSSLRLPEELLDEAFFRVALPPHIRTDSTGRVRCRAMKKNPVTTYTAYDEVTLSTDAGAVVWEGEGRNLVMVVDRYTGSAGRSQGFLTGPETISGAFATTHAHDHHNLLIIGSHVGDMRLAAQWVIARAGGIAIAVDGKLRAVLDLPVGGILSDQGMDQLSESFIAIQHLLGERGIRHPNPFMSLSTLTLPVSPDIKITDKGLVDVRSGTLRDLFIERP